LDTSSDLTLSNENLTVEQTLGSNGWRTSRATTAKSSGKWYFEILLDVCPAGLEDMVIGLSDSALSLNTFVGNSAASWSFHGPNGYTYHNGSAIPYGNIWTQGDIIGCAFDMGTGRIWWAINNVWQKSGDPVAQTNPAYSNLTGTLFPAISMYRPGHKATATFADDFLFYTPPVGYSPLEIIELTEPILVFKREEIQKVFVYVKEKG
jgi:hypothetical protein